MALKPPGLNAAQEDIDGVMRATLDYVEGFTTADPERHARAYHPEALKRRFYISDDSGIDMIEYITPQGMVDYAATGMSKVDEIEYEVVIDDITEGVASVRLYSTKWIDFLHIVKARGEWRIIHVLWNHQPGQGA